MFFPPKTVCFAEESAEESLRPPDPSASLRGEIDRKTYLQMKADLSWDTSETKNEPGAVKMIQKRIKN